MRSAVIVLLVVFGVGLGAGAHGQVPPRVLPQPEGIPEASLQCRQAIAVVERAAGIPAHLMSAIARIESGRSDGKGGVHPWPWTINVEGAGYTYDSKAEAIAAVRAFQAKGARSIDVGCMQVNLMYHPTAFASLDEGFDPMANARYAARYLNDLYAQTKDWTKATAHYHSATPDLGTNYQRKVFAVLPDEQRKRIGLLGPPGPAGGNVWTNNAFTQNVWNSRGPGWPSESGIPRSPPIPATGGFMLSNRSDATRTIPAPAGTPGRGLDAYRGAPVPVASRTAAARL